MSATPAIGRIGAGSINGIGELGAIVPSISKVTIADGSISPRIAEDASLLLSIAPLWNRKTSRANTNRIDERRIVMGNAPKGAPVS